MQTHSRSFRLTMFAVLYFVQGAGLAYFRNFQKPYLDKLGIDADVIGLLTSILLLPFVLKIFIGMLSDRVNLFGFGHRKPYILLGLLLAGLSFFGASLVLPDTNFLLFAVLIVAGSFSVTLFDSTADGLAIDITPAGEQGSVQGSMVGGRAMGFIVLSLAFGTLVQTSGYRVVFLIVAVMMLLPIAWVLRVREPEHQPGRSAFEWAAFRALVQPRFLLFALYAVVYSIFSFGVDGLVTYAMSDSFAAPETLIGQYGALRGLGAVIGAAGGGLLIDRLGRGRSAYGAALLITLGAGLIGAASSAANGAHLLLPLGVFWGIAWGFQETIFVALAMALSDARIAASMFAIMMAFSNIGTAAGEGLATGLTDNIGFSNVFWLMAVLNLLILPILWGLFRVMSRPDPALAEVETVEG